jgi:hypothetical protein
MGKVCLAGLCCALALLGCASDPADSGATGNGGQQTVLPPPMTGASPTPTPTTPTPTSPTPTSPVPTTPVDPMGMAGSGGIDTTPVTPTPTDPAAVASGISITPITYDDPNLQCFEFRAHAAGNPSQPLSVGVANDKYIEVNFDAPWTGTVYGRSFRSLIDNAEVIHHWLFYKGAAEGSRSMMVGWAPGGSDTYFSPDLGMELPQQQYSIQYHYNSGDASAVDASGVEVCYTTQKPENVATLSWLGTDAIGGTSATGTCVPNAQNRVHILAGTPHMHKKGIHFKVEIMRAAGGIDIAHDDAFDFAYQQQYPEDLWLEPGDTIKTTCTYNAPATFGPGTDAEMCYWFAVHYPANSLVDNGPIGKLIHGPNSCLGM